MEEFGLFAPFIYGYINHMKFKEEGFHLWQFDGARYIGQFM
jgi:hypothetical protein